MDYRRILLPLPGDIDDQCECKKDPSKCPSYCYAFYPPDEYVVPPPPLSTPDHHSGLPRTPIIIIIVLCSLFLVLTCYAVATQFCIGWRTRSPSIRQGRDEEEEEEEGGEVMEPPVNYVWYINTVGLQQAVINAITICKYKKGDGLIEGTECSVCLSEFRDDEDVRLLPKCSHAFHVNCIDTWLRSHVNCPLCRAHIVSSPAILSADNLQVPDDNPVGRHENAQNVTGLDMHADGQNLEEELTSEAEREDGRMMDVKTLNGESSSGTRAISDLTGNHGEDELILEIGTGEELQPVRRSVSMDSSAASKIYSSLVAARQAKQDADNKKGSQARAKGSSLLNRPVAMKRSYSSSGNFFPKRHNRNRSSVLPL